MANEPKIMCVNIFQHEDTAERQKVFTLRWIELIRQYEKQKQYAVPHMR